MAPFTEVAATRPDVAWFPRVRTPAEIATVTADNRMIAEPYPKLMNSFPTVDLAAALFVTTDETADRLGIAADARVYPWATGHCAEVGPPSVRPVFHESAALAAAIDAALRGADLGVADLTGFDLYSCFPAAVQMSTHVLGLAPHDPRRLTLTGGLPYFGGPGANYVTHALVSAVERCRTAAGERVLVVGVGGAPSDFAATAFAAVPPAAPWRIDRCAEVRVTLEATRVPVDNTRTGTGRVVAATVMHERDRGPVRAGVVVEFADGVRAGARTADPAMVTALAGHALVDRDVRVVEADGHREFHAE
jgi:acetyl-CoA C-acetyltransferase